jgi:hypothetical protein
MYSGITYACVCCPLPLSCPSQVDKNHPFSIGGEEGAYVTRLSNTVVFLFAGHDTTGHTMTWLLYELARHPAMQRRVQQEADEMFAELEVGGYLFSSRRHSHALALPRTRSYTHSHSPSRAHTHSLQAKEAAIWRTEIAGASPT